MTIGLATIINTVKQQLVDSGFAIADRIPEVDATFTILQSDDLGTVQNALGFVDGLSTWLPVIGLGLLAVAVAIARDRRRVLFAAGIAVAASMLLLGATLNVIRPIYLDALPAERLAGSSGRHLRPARLVHQVRAARPPRRRHHRRRRSPGSARPRGSGAAARAGLVRGIDAVRRGAARAGLDTGRFGVVPPAVPRRRSGPASWRSPRSGTSRSTTPRATRPLVRRGCRRHAAPPRAAGRRTGGRLIGRRARHRPRGARHEGRLAVAGLEGPGRARRRRHRLRRRRAGLAG